MSVLQVTFDHQWSPIGYNFNHHDKPGRWIVWPDTWDVIAIWHFLNIDLEYSCDRVERCLDSVERFERGDVVQGCVGDGYAPPGVMAEGNDGAAYFGNNHVLIASDHADERRVLLTSEQFKILLRHILTTMDHPAYRDPGPEEEDPYQPIMIEILAFGEDALDEYYKRGGVTPARPEGNG